MNIDRLRKGAVAIHIFVFFLLCIYFFTGYPTENIDKIQTAIKDAGLMNPQYNEYLEGALYILALSCFLMFYISAWRNYRVALYYYLAFFAFTNTASIFFSETTASVETEVEGFLEALLFFAEAFICTSILFFGKAKKPERNETKLEQSDKSFCGSCGEKIESSSRFCGGCGAAV